MKRQMHFLILFLVGALLIGPVPQIAAQSGSDPVATPAPAPVAPTSELIAAYEGVLQRIYEEVNPSVVHIQVIQKGVSISSLLPPDHPEIPDVPDMPEMPELPTPPEELELPPQLGTGSGFVWDTQGRIVTNYHVVQDAEDISIIFDDGAIVDGEVIGVDPDNDLAVVQVDLSADRLKPVTMGDSTQVKVGELVVAIGNPFGLESTMTTGIVSALGRMLPVEASTDPLMGAFSIPDVIQTDASINPGNSGGVLLNDQGEVIGVTSAIISPIRASAGIGFAIPSTIVQKVVPILIEKGRYPHAWLGISGYTLTPDVATMMGLDKDQRGALVVDVVSNGPADEAGVRGSDRQIEINGEERRVGGDIIVAVDGEAVVKFDDIVTYLARNTEVGQKLTLTVLRNGNSEKIEVELGSRPGDQAEPQATTRATRGGAWLGIVGIDLTPEIAEVMELPADQEGVLVQQVQQKSPADEAGIRGSYKPIIMGEIRVLVGGDVITAIDGEAITTMDELVAFVRHAEPDQQIAITLLRDGKEMEVSVTLTKQP